MKKYKQFNGKIIRMLLAAIFLISIFYLYFLNSTIRAVIENENDSQKLKIASQEYQNLESRYFALLGIVNLDYAHQLGFVDQAQKADYIVRENAVALR